MPFNYYVPTSQKTSCLHYKEQQLLSTELPLSRYDIFIKTKYICQSVNLQVTTLDPLVLGGFWAFTTTQTKNLALRRHILTTAIINSESLWETKEDAWFQASPAMSIRSALFWDFMQHRMVILYRRFGTTYRSHLQGSGNPRGILAFFFFYYLEVEDVDRYVVPKRRIGITILRCVKYQKRADINEEQIDIIIYYIYTLFFFTGATTHCGFVFCSPLVAL